MTTSEAINEKAPCLSQPLGILNIRLSYLEQSGQKGGRGNAFLLQVPDSEQTIARTFPSSTMDVKHEETSTRRRRLGRLFKTPEGKGLPLPAKKPKQNTQESVPTIRLYVVGFERKVRLVLPPSTRVATFKLILDDAIG
jgi:hypothetical protein